jgi:hypothetical protein
VILTLFYSGIIFNLLCVIFCKCNFVTTNPFANAFTVYVLYYLDNDNGKYSHTRIISFVPVHHVDTVVHYVYEAESS